MRKRAIKISVRLNEQEHEHLKKQAAISGYPIEPFIVNAQELVLCGSHVDKLGLALTAFLIKELVYRLLSRRLFQISADDLVHRFP